MGLEHSECFEDEVVSWESPQSVSISQNAGCVLSETLLYRRWHPRLTLLPDTRVQLPQKLLVSPERPFQQLKQLPGLFIEVSLTRFFSLVLIAVYRRHRGSDELAAGECRDTVIVGQELGCALTSVGVR